MSWAAVELEAINLGDARLNRRVINIFEDIGLFPGRTIPQSFTAWGETKACYNFFRNSSVSTEKLLQPHMNKTIERIKEHKVVLLPSDTTEIDYTTKAAMKGKERLSNKKSGLWLHPTIAVTPERLMLGIIDADFWHRNPERADKNRTALDKAPIEEKESFRWLKSYRRACEVARECPETRVISMFDREGDIIEVFEEANAQAKAGHCAFFIIRSNHDRLIEGVEQDKGERKLRSALKQSSSLGEIEFNMPSRGERKGRKVKQEIKAISAALKPSNKDKKVTVHAIMAIEKDPPQGEDPITWVLITNLPADTFDEVTQIINYYLCRWEIEMFFKVLKSGCKIEERQLQTTTRMKNLIALFMILSWRIMFTMMLGRTCSEMSCSEIFEESEWKSVYKILHKNKHLPRKPPPLGEFIIMVALLGGYVEKKDEEPGVKVMWAGMARMVDFSLAWECFGG